MLYKLYSTTQTNLKYIHLMFYKKIIMSHFINLSIYLCFKNSQILHWGKLSPVLPIDLIQAKYGFKNVYSSDIQEKR